MYIEMGVCTYMSTISGIDGWKKCLVKNQTGDKKARFFWIIIKWLKKTVFIYFNRLLTSLLMLCSLEADTNLTAGTFGSRPLLAPCLNGLGKLSHLIDLDYIGDLMNYLKRLASGNSSCNSSQKCLKQLTVSERLHCCIVAFKVMRSNLDALNVDLQEFFVQLYNLILEYRPGR